MFTILCVNTLCDWMRFVLIIIPNCELPCQQFDYMKYKKYVYGILSYASFFMHFSPGAMTTHAESINSNLQRGLDRGLRHTTLNTEQNQLAIKVSADN